MQRGVLRSCIFPLFLLERLARVASVRLVWYGDSRIEPSRAPRNDASLDQWFLELEYEKARGPDTQQLRYGLD